MALRILADPLETLSIDADRYRSELRIGYNSGAVVYPLSAIDSLIERLTEIRDRLNHERREERLYEDIQ